MESQFCDWMIHFLSAKERGGGKVVEFRPKYLAMLTHFYFMPICLRIEI